MLNITLFHGELSKSRDEVEKLSYHSRSETVVTIHRNTLESDVGSGANSNGLGASIKDLVCH